MKTTTIKQTLSFRTTPEKVYDAFMDANKHREFTGFKAEIENKVGGKFVTCGERNIGYSLVLEPGKRIVQAWTQKSFPDKHYSIIDLKITDTGNGNTELDFHQYGAPEECLEWLETGWNRIYWEPLKAYLEEGTIQELTD